jgi:hypothetical protein
LWSWQIMCRKYGTTCFMYVFTGVLLFLYNEFNMRGQHRDVPYLRCRSELCRQ